MDPLGTIITLALVISGVAQENEFKDVAQDPEFRDVSSCMCPGCELVVECTITGGGATVWQGTIFDGCQNENIKLRHSRFTTGIVIHESCGTRQSLVGRSVSVANGSFTSQLLVNASEELSGKIIECANESGQIVDSKTIDTPSLSDLPTPMNVKFNNGMPPKTIPGELTITWELVFEDTPDATHNQGYNVLLNTSNCGMCLTTTSSNSFTVCNLTESNVQLDINCTVLVIIEDSMECDITKNTTGELSLSDHKTTTTAGWVATGTWSPRTSNDRLQQVFLVSLPLATVGLLSVLLVAAVIVVVTMKKYRSRRKKQIIRGTQDRSEHSANPIGSEIMDLGQYSLLQNPSNEEGMMTYLEIGPDTRIRTEVIADADRVEYAEVSHAQPQKSVIKTNVDLYLNLDTLLIQVRHHVTPLWHEFGVAAGVPMDTLNKCLNCTPEESTVEVLDYWLRQSNKTWRDVARVLNEIHLRELAEKILTVYDTGSLPTAVVDENITIPAITSAISNDSEATSEKGQTPPPPPLPPKP